MPVTATPVMNRKYEGLIVLNTKGKEEGADALIAKVKEQMEEEGASVSKVDALGRRKFAYNARHLETGYYATFHFEADPASIHPIQARLKLNPDVFLQHYQRLN